jgi:hypothetical protein
VISLFEAKAHHLREAYFDSTIITALLTSKDSYGNEVKADKHRRV